MEPGQAIFHTNRQVGGITSGGVVLDNADDGVAKRPRQQRVQNIFCGCYINGSAFGCFWAGGGWCHYFTPRLRIYPLNN